MGHSETSPIVTTLCGSTRFPDAFALANMHLSLQGRIVIGLGMLGHADEPRGAKFLTSDGDESTPEKQGLDQLHFRKIDLSDGIYVVNVGGYVGSSTRREIAYAQRAGKAVEWMFPDAIPALDCAACRGNEVLDDGCQPYGEEVTVPVERNAETFIGEHMPDQGDDDA